MHSHLESKPFHSFRFVFHRGSFRIRGRRLFSIRWCCLEGLGGATFLSSADPPSFVGVTALIPRIIWKRCPWWTRFESSLDHFPALPHLSIPTISCLLSTVLSNEGRKRPRQKNVSFVIFIFCLIYFLQVFPLRLHAAFVHHYYSAEMPISRLQLLPAIQLFHRVCPRYINLHTTRYKQISGNFSPSVFLLSFSSYFFFLSCFTLILSHSLPLSFSFTLSSSLFLFFRLLCLSFSVALTGIHARRHSCNIQRRGWEGHARTCMSPL